MDAKQREQGAEGLFIKSHRYSVFIIDTTIVKEMFIMMIKYSQKNINRGEIVS